MSPESDGLAIQSFEMLAQEIRLYIWSEGLPLTRIIATIPRQRSGAVYNIDLHLNLVTEKSRYDVRKKMEEEGRIKGNAKCEQKVQRAIKRACSY